MNVAILNSLQDIAFYDDGGGGGGGGGGGDDGGGDGGGDGNDGAHSGDGDRCRQLGSYTIKHYYSNEKCAVCTVCFPSNRTS